MKIVAIICIVTRSVEDPTGNFEGLLYVQRYADSASENHHNGCR